MGLLLLQQLFGGASVILIIINNNGEALAMDTVGTVGSSAANDTVIPLSKLIGMNNYESKPRVSTDISFPYARLHLTV